MDWHSPALSAYRLRAVHIGVQLTVITVAVLFAYTVLPGRVSMDETVFRGLLLLALAGAVAVALLPWQTFFRRGWAIWAFYLWSAVDIALISATIAFTGGHASPLFLVYALTTIFFAASYPPRGQAVLLLATIASYLLVLYVVDGRVEGTLVFMRLAAIALIAYMTLFLSRELIAQILNHDAAARGLRESEERFRLLASASHDAIWDWNLVTGELWWSDGFEKLFGWPPEEAGSTFEAWSQRLHPEDRERVVNGVHDVIERGAGHWSAEYRFERRDGGYAYVLDRGDVIADASGKPVRMVGGMTDLTERRDLELQLVQAQKMESVGRLAGGVAHDFNNLLAVMLGTIDLTLSDLDEDDPHHADLQEAREAAQRAASLTRQLLAFGRRQVMLPRVLDLDIVVQDMLGMLRRLIGEDIEIRFFPAHDPPNVRADPGQIEQVVLNLAINARDAMPSGGVLTIETGEAVINEARSARLGGIAPGRYATLRVADTGIGMDEATRLQIFEPFFTTKEPGQGTGLGLSTVYGIVSQSGGGINVESEVGRGTTFEIFLPLVPAESASESEEEPPADRGTETVLLAEDEDTLRAVTARVLEASGYTVLAAASGEEALELLRSRGNRIDLLLTDVVMPGMSGRDLAQRIIKRHPGTRVLYTSGYTEEIVRLRAVLEESARLVSKPYTAEELRAEVRQLLDTPSRPSAAGGSDY